MRQERLRQNYQLTREGSEDGRVSGHRSSIPPSRSAGSKARREECRVGPSYVQAVGPVLYQNPAETGYQPTTLLAPGCFSWVLEHREIHPMHTKIFSDLVDAVADGALAYRETAERSYGEPASASTDRGS